MKKVVYQYKIYDYDTEEERGKHLKEMQKRDWELKMLYTNNLGKLVAEYQKKER